MSHTLELAKIHCQLAVIRWPLSIRIPNAFRTHLETIRLRPYVSIVAGDARLGHALRGQKLVVHIILPAHGVFFFVGED